MATHLSEEFTLAATGDAILTREILPYEGKSTEFDQLLGTLRDADATATNLEVIVHDYEGYPSAASGGTYMRAPPKVLDELDAMGCDLFSAATNHVFDFTYGGIERTLDELEKRDLAAAGLGMNLYEARRPAYAETAAGRVGMVSSCSSITPGSSAGAQSPALPGRPGLSPLSVEPIYHVTEDELEALQGISESAGIEAMKQSWLDRGIYYNHDWNDPEYFHFGDMKFRTVGDEAETGLRYEATEEDRAAIIDEIEAGVAKVNEGNSSPARRPSSSSRSPATVSMPGQTSSLALGRTSSGGSRSTTTARSSTRSGTSSSKTRPSSGCRPRASIDTTSTA